MKNMNIVIASVIASAIASASAFSAEWKFDNQIFENKATAMKYARNKALSEAKALFDNPQGQFIPLEKGKNQYLAIPRDHELAEKFRCEKRNGEKLLFEGKEICVLTLRQYANKIVFPSYELEKQAKDESGFRRASGN